MIFRLLALQSLLLLAGGAFAGSRKTVRRTLDETDSSFEDSSFEETSMADEICYANSHCEDFCNFEYGSGGGHCEYCENLGSTCAAELFATDTGTHACQAVCEWGAEDEDEDEEGDCSDCKIGFARAGGCALYLAGSLELPTPEDEEDCDWDECETEVYQFCLATDGEVVADVTTCTAHTDCVDVKDADMTDMGDTYCYDEGLFDTGVADGQQYCGGHAFNCCACADDDSIDGECPEESDCDNFCAAYTNECHNICTEDENDAMFETCSTLFETLDTGCSSTCDMDTKHYMCEDIMNGFGWTDDCDCSAYDADAPPTPKVEVLLKFTGLTPTSFETAKPAIKDTLSNSTGVHVDSITLTLITSSRRALSESTVKAEFETEDDDDATTLTNTITALDVDELATEMEEAMDDVGVTVTMSRDALEVSIVTESPTSAPTPAPTTTTTTTTTTLSATTTTLSATTTTLSATTSTTTTATTTTTLADDASGLTLIFTIAISTYFL